MATLAELFDDISKWNKNKSQQAYYLQEINNCLLELALTEVPPLTFPYLAQQAALDTHTHRLSYTTGFLVTGLPAVGATITAGSMTGTITEITGDAADWVLATGEGYMYLSDVTGTLAVTGDAIAVTGGGTAVLDEDTVWTPWVILPTDYGKGITNVISAAQGTESDIKIKQSVREIVTLYGNLDNEGQVEYCTVVGPLLMLQPVPVTSDTLTLYYYRKPTTVSAIDETELEMIPVQLQRSIIPFYVLRNLNVGDAQKWQYYNQLYMAGVTNLVETLKPFHNKQVQNIYRGVNFF